MTTVCSTLLLLISSFILLYFCLFLISSFLLLYCYCCLFLISSFFLLSCCLFLISSFFLLYCCLFLISSFLLLYCCLFLISFISLPPSLLQEATDGIQRCLMNQSVRNDSPEDVNRRAMSEPEVQQIKSDPAMRMSLEQMQKDPQALSE